MSYYNRTFIRDLAERAVVTYIEVFLGMLIVSGVTDWSAVQAAAFAAIPAALSVIKSALASRIPGTASPASLVKG